MFAIIYNCVPCVAVANDTGFFSFRFFDLEVFIFVSEVKFDDFIDSLEIFIELAGKNYQ